MLPGDRLAQANPELPHDPADRQDASRRRPSTSFRRISAARILAVQEKSGFVPNVFLTLAYRPDEFRAFFAYHDALMEQGLAA